MDDSTEDPRLTQRGLWSSVSDGVEWVSRLVAATSVLSLLSKIKTVPPSIWFEKVLTAYRSLFHPIIDETIGLIPGLFGWVLLPATKDVIIVYGILCTSVFRAFVALTKDDQEREPKRSLIFPAMFWPIYLVWMFLGIAVFARVFPEEQGNTSRAASIVSKAIAKELFIIVVVSTIATALSAVDKL